MCHEEISIDFSRLEVAAQQIGEDPPRQFPESGDDGHCRFGSGGSVPVGSPCPGQAQE